jgi:iron complex transport system ATP-binding protein
MTIVELSKIVVVRGGTTILSDISWQIEQGQHWAVLGANGSGKTTLLKVVTGYEWPTDGVVTVLRQQYGRCNLSELRKAIGWVSSSIEQRMPQRDSALEIVVSGFYASLGLYREPTVEEWDRARTALLAVGGRAYEGRPFGLLSQGEQQRVLIARALVNRPELLILDEPCAGLDPAAREEFLLDLGRLACSPDAPGILLVTHHIEEIGPWIDHILVLKNGRTLAYGRTEAVLSGQVLGEAFGCECAVERLDQRYRLRVIPGRGHALP